MALELKTKQKLSQEADVLARSYSLVRHRGTTYMPADFETADVSVTPPPERTMWLPMNREAIKQQAAATFSTLFATDSELSSFDFMVSQHAQRIDALCTTLLVRTTDGLRELRGDGQLHDPSGLFVANTMLPMLNTDEIEKKRVFGVIAEWVDSEEEADSLLKHFATALAPGWSAVKYVMLLGEGRNGKSLLLRMMQQVFGWQNCSHITRQDISAQSPVVCELNGKLLNIVFDGLSEYVKDSGTEKTLIAGEQVSIRKLYESTPTPVQTNALFVEGLNHEPKSKDKSTALQKRLVRFQFDNVYALDHKFERIMLSQESLGAFLSLLIDRYVHEDHVAEALAPTGRALELQIEHMFTNSLGLQFLKYHDETDALGLDGLIGTNVDQLAQLFQTWRLKENDMQPWSAPDVITLFQPILNTERKSVRIGGVPRKIRVLTSFKSEALAFMETLKGEADAEVILAHEEAADRPAEAPSHGADD